MPAIPTIQEAQGYYLEGTQAKATKWEARTTAAAPTWETNAKSAQSEEAYRIGVTNAAQMQLRLKGLRDVSAAEFAGAVRGRSGSYREKTAARAGKWAQNFSPCLDTIGSVVQRLGARVPGDVSGNIDRRVKPIGEALHQQKIGGGGGAGYTPAPTGGFGGGF